MYDFNYNPVQIQTRKNECLRKPRAIALSLCIISFNKPPYLFGGRFKSSGRAGSQVARRMTQSESWFKVRTVDNTIPESVHSSEESKLLVHTAKFGIFSGWDFVSSCGQQSIPVSGIFLSVWRCMALRHQIMETSGALLRRNVFLLPFSSHSRCEIKWTGGGGILTKKEAVYSWLKSRTLLTLRGLTPLLLPPVAQCAFLLRRFIKRVEEGDALAELTDGIGVHRKKSIREYH